MITKIKIFTSIIFFSVALRFPCAEMFSLEKAISTGLKNNFNIQISENISQQSQNNTTMALGNLLPKADLEGSIIRNRSDDQSNSATAVDGVTNSTISSAKIKVSWTLFDGFQMFYGYSSLYRHAELAKLQHRENVEFHVLEIIRDYFNLITQKQQLELAKKILQISEEKFKKILIKKDLGAATEREYLNSLVALNTDSSNLRLQEIQVITAKHQLHISLALPLDQNLEVPDKIVVDSATGSLASWLEDAKENNTGLNISQKIKKIEALNKSMSRSIFWPTITATGSYGLTNSSIDGPSGNISSDSKDASAGLVARFNIFNGFRDWSSVKNATLALENSEKQIQHLTLQLEALVHQQWKVIQYAFKQIQFEKKAVDLATRNFELSQSYFDLGKINHTELREAQAALAEAMNRLAVAKFEARIAKVELERMAGKIKLTND